MFNPYFKVGYLGTIEMPEGLGREGGLQEIRNCIRRLRVEKKVNSPSLSETFFFVILIS